MEAEKMVNRIPMDRSCDAFVVEILSQHATHLLFYFHRQKETKGNGRRKGGGKRTGNEEKRGK